MDKTKELKQKARVPDDSILAVVSVLSNDETELKLEKHKRYRFTESELSEYAQQASREKNEEISQLKDIIISLENKNAYPDTEADGVVFCGKCGTAI